MRTQILFALFTALVLGACGSASAPVPLQADAGASEGSQVLCPGGSELRSTEGYMVGIERKCGKDVGECHSGKQKCGPDGKWSECEGEVGPKSELCDGKDNDCDGQIDNGFEFQTNAYHCGSCGTSCLEWKKDDKPFCRQGICVGEKAEPVVAKKSEKSGTITCAGNTVFINGDLVGSLDENQRKRYVDDDWIESVSLAMDEGSCWDNEHDCMETPLCAKDRAGIWRCESGRYARLKFTNVPKTEFAPRVRLKKYRDSEVIYLDLSKWEILGTCARIGCEDACREGENCLRDDFWYGKNRDCRVSTSRISRR